MALEDAIPSRIRGVDCPACHSPTRVLESRRAESGAALRRRRECSRCATRFTTYERREAPTLFVRKRNGRRESFVPDKVRSGMLRAAYKRPVSPRDLDSIVERIGLEIEANGGVLDTSRVGELCLAGLREVDRISYLQFASVYRQLTDVEDVEAELRRLGAATPSDDRASGPSRGSVPSGPGASITSPLSAARAPGSGRRNFVRRDDGAHRKRR